MPTAHNTPIDEYGRFLQLKAQAGARHGFDPVWMPDFLFDFQQTLVEWALLAGRGALFCDCGMGKSPMSIVWGENSHERSQHNFAGVRPQHTGAYGPCE